MSAELGNKWWMLRTKHGRDKIFTDPDLLWQEAVKYFEHTDNRKWIKKDWVGKDADEVERENETPYTWSGLALFLDCDVKTLRATKASEGFFPIITRIEQIIYTQKIEGAAVGAFNANIVSRELGLVEKSETKNDTIVTVDLTPEKIKEISKHLHDTV